MEIRKRARRNVKKLSIILIVLSLVMVFIVYGAINSFLRPALLDMARVRVNALTSDAMYSTVLDMLAKEEGDYQFFDVMEQDGQVYYMELNNRLLTVFASECAQEAQARLIAYGEQGLDIPLGTASGVPALAGKGPIIHMSFYPQTNTQAYFSSEFYSAGINQTLHRVMLKLESQMGIILPGATEIINCYVEVPIAEQLIVGKVPDAYAGIQMGDGKLNLVPQE